MNKKYTVLRTFLIVFLSVVTFTPNLFSQNRDSIETDFRYRRYILREQIRQERILEKKYKRQERIEKESSKKYAAAIHPLSLLGGNLRFDFDMRLSQRSWLQATPAIYLFPSVLTSYYYSDSYYYFDDYKVSSLSGAGLDLEYKCHLFRKRVFYCFGGLKYSYLMADYQYYDYISFQEDNQNFYRYGIADGTQHFNTLGICTGVGVRTLMGKGFFIDAQLGVGYRYAFYDENKVALDKDVFDYGYRGIYPVMGFSLGWAW